MKNLILISLLITCSFTYGQDVLIYKSGGRVFNANNQKISSDDVRALMMTNPEALNLYNSGRTKKTLGNILLYGGIATFSIKHISIINKYKNNPYGTVDSNNILYFVSAGIILVSLPIKIGYSKKIEQAVSLINADFKNPKTTFNIESTQIIANRNGIGLAITF